MSDKPNDPPALKAPYAASFPGRIVLVVPIYKGQEQKELSFQFEPGVMPSIEQIRNLFTNFALDAKEGRVNKEIKGYTPLSMVEFQNALNAVHAFKDKTVVNLGDTPQ